MRPVFIIASTFHDFYLILIETVVKNLLLKVNCLM